MNTQPSTPSPCSSEGVQVTPEEREVLEMQSQSDTFLEQLLRARASRVVARNEAKQRQDLLHS